MRDWTTDQINLYLFRHGATAGNESRRYIGVTDEPLSAAGETALREKKLTISPSVVFVSPMLRCRQSAALLFPEAEKIEIAQWREIDFGAFEGKTYGELSRDPRYQAWVDSGGALPFPDGESRELFCARCIDGMETVLSCLRERTKGKEGAYTAAAVVHGGTIMALASHYGDGDYFSWQVPNGGGIRLQILGALTAPEIRPYTLAEETEGGTGR